MAQVVKAQTVDTRLFQCVAPGRSEFIRLALGTFAASVSKH